MMSGGEGGEGRGQKVLSKPSADSFAVGRRQKAGQKSNGHTCGSNGQLTDMDGNSVDVSLPNSGTLSVLPE
jgi:hypothetical protein